MSRDARKGRQTQIDWGGGGGHGCISTLRIPTPMRLAHSEVIARSIRSNRDTQYQYSILVGKII